MRNGPLSVFFLSFVLVVSSQIPAFCAVPAPPVVRLNDPQVSGLAVSVNGVALPGYQGATITRISWNWGDGSSGNSWFPASHTYRNPSTYSITVTAYQSDGRSTTATTVARLYVTPTTQRYPPSLSLYTPQVNGLSVSINGVAAPGTSGASITRIFWNWGDGRSGNQWFPGSHTYDRGGSYTVTVTAYQSDGLSTTRSVTAVVRVSESTSLDSYTKDWAGYVVLAENIVDETGDITGVWGEWTVPDVSGSPRDSDSPIWVGIGGVGVPNLIQIGTDQSVNILGQVEYSAWYETLPWTITNRARKIAGFDIRPGHEIRAGIYLSSPPNGWVLYIKNKSTRAPPWEYPIQYSSNKKTAEWIVEKPARALFNDWIPTTLTNFGSIRFTNCVVTTGGKEISLLNMGGSSRFRFILTDNGMDSGKILAQPGPVDTSNSFVVYQGQTMPYVQYETTTVRTATATTSQTYRTQSDWTAPLATVTGATGWANIVRNGGFEDEYSEWKWGLPETRAKLGVTITQGKSHSGSRSLLVEGDGETLWQEYDMVPLKPGTHLSYFSYLERNAGYENPQSYFQLLLTRHMSDGTTMTAMIGIYMTIENKANSEEFSAGNYPVIWIRYNGNPVNSWIKTEIDVWTVFDKHFNNPDEFRIYKIITGGSQFGAYLDDISLTVPGVNIARTTWQQDVPVSDAGGSHIVSILVLGVIILSGFLALTLAMLRHKNTSKRVFL